MEVALYILALLLELLLCIWSASAERRTPQHEHDRLHKLYQRHCLLLELLQYAIVLLCCYGQMQELRHFSSAESCYPSALAWTLVKRMWHLPFAITMLSGVHAIDAWRIPTAWKQFRGMLFMLTRERLEFCKYLGLPRPCNAH